MQKNSGNDSHGAEATSLPGGGGISIAVPADEERGGYERVFSFVRGQLLDGTLKVGDRLLPERQLATRLGISRPVVREVLRTLAALGVVEIRHGHGSVVRTPGMDNLDDFFTLMLAQRAEAVDDVLEARIAIERHAIRLACTRATASDLEHLEQSWQRIRDTIHDPIAGGAADFDFHCQIVDAAHSATLSTLYAAIASLLRRSHAERRVRISEIKGIDGFLVDHHRLILVAMIERHADRADGLLAQHFEIGSTLQRRAISSELDTAGGTAARATLHTRTP